MPLITLAQSGLILSAISDHEALFRHAVAEPLSRLLQMSYPREVQDVLRSYTGLSESVGGIQLKGPYTIADNWAPLIKRIILDRRRSTAAHVESQRSRTHHAELIAEAEAALGPYEEFIRSDWFANTVPFQMPRLADFVTLEHALEDFHRTFSAPENIYDEKFHILLAPQCFLKDIEYYRAIGEIRGAPLTIAFLDIDNFKAFNTVHTETIVDRDVLPRFMRAIDAACFAHGRAYRFGGDEYVLLLPNMTRDYSVTFLTDLKDRLAQLKYPGVSRSTTVSSGFCFVEPDCHLTDKECLGKANTAKQHAKSNGKNCISSYERTDFAEVSLKVFSK
jgi:diguanylate cyclase (GGDEF)-like protein